MTAKRQSLIEKGVILQDFPDATQLLSKENVNFEALCDYAKLAAYVSTNRKLNKLVFAKNHYGQADVAMFDFTSLFQSENASRIIERRGKKLLMSLVGDSLLEVNKNKFLSLMSLENVLDSNFNGFFPDLKWESWNDNLRKLSF